jgi:hypothetical protein
MNESYHDAMLAHPISEHRCLIMDHIMNTSPSTPERGDALIALSTVAAAASPAIVLTVLPPPSPVRPTPGSMNKTWRHGDRVLSSKSHRRPDQLHRYLILGYVSDDSIDVSRAPWVARTLVQSAVGLLSVGARGTTIHAVRNVNISLPRPPRPHPSHQHQHPPLPPLLSLPQPLLSSSPL